jgi:di/tricarboxylate transporter
LNIQQISFLVILVIAFWLLITERLRNDIVSVLIILALAITGVLSTSEALSGFGSEPAIIVASVFIMSGAFHKTGLSEAIGAWVGRFAGKGYSKVLVVIMLSVALLSAFTHHVTTTALMLPVVLTLCQERRLSASKLLMPLSFAASLGTTITIIGAPAFLIASNVLQHYGRPGLGIFSISPIGLSLSLAGTLFMLVIGRFLLPEREGGGDLSDFYRLDRYFTELKIRANSSFIGKTVDEVAAKGHYRFLTVGWVRNGRGQCRPLGNTKLMEGDVLWVHAPPEDMIAFRQEKGIELHPVERYELENDRFEASEGDPSQELVQAVIAPQSDLIRRSLKDVGFRSRYGAIVVGLWRRGGLLCQELADIKLEPGDVLVLQGNHESLSRVSLHSLHQ